jgi:replicative DNA helicase Mcm
MPAELTEQERTEIEEFLTERCKDEMNLIGEMYPKKQSLLVDFQDLAEYSPKLGDKLIVSPEDVIREFNRTLAKETAHIAFAKVDEEPRITARFRNLPAENEIMIRECTSQYLSRFFIVQGMVTKVTDVLPRVWKGVFQCKRCRAEAETVQQERTIRMPIACEQCGRKEFELVEDKSKFIDFQKIEVQEPLEILKGGEQAKRIAIWLEDDLTNKVLPGQKIIVAGILKLEAPKFRGTVYQKFIDANNVEFAEHEFEDIEISEADEKKIKKLAKDPKVLEKIIASIAPSIYGHNEAKEAIALQLCGGTPNKKLPDGTRIRDNIHILLIGDPGTAKSQILKYVDRLAPKSMYVSGKSATGGGLTAIAEKDEFGEGGWVLKAGALVLASGGIVCLDEFGQMDEHESSAIHEALEQQSYHPGTELLLGNGERVKIGCFVDEFFDKHREKIVKGVDCEILYSKDAGIDTEILTCDLNKDNRVFPTHVDRISRHKAPDRFIRITYSNGREITVTPEHPIFTFENGRINTLRADRVREGMMAPAPRILPTGGGVVKLRGVEKRHHNCKDIKLPLELDGDVSRLLGYIVSEGHSYSSKKNGVSELMISNTDPGIIDDAKNIVSGVFGINPYIQVQHARERCKATKNLYTVRALSSTLYDFFKLNFPEVMGLSDKKRVPTAVFRSSDEDKIEFLIGAFRGDGFYDSERFGYTTNSHQLAKDYMDLMLNLGIYSYIADSGEYRSRREGKDKTAYKVVISGHESMKSFYELVGQNDKRREKLAQFVLRSKNKLNDHDKFPQEFVVWVRDILKDYRLDDGYFYKHIRRGAGAHREVLSRALARIESRISILSMGGTNNVRAIRKGYKLSISSIARRLGMSDSMVTYMERNPKTRTYPILLTKVKSMAEEKILNTRKKLAFLRGYLSSDLRFIKINRAEEICDKGVEWVYDVTIEPEHTFISEGLVLHNTVSVAKAGIIATFKANSAVLAAANPKYSRFDPYKPPAEQFDIPPTLISRFDLIFPIRDVLDETKDRELAMHILSAHKLSQATAISSKEDLTEIRGRLTPPIEEELLRKYIAYVRKNIYPILTDEAINRLRDYYVNLRKRGASGSVPLTPRQLEALVRLGEASAKLRLSKRVELQDAETAIRLVEFVLTEVGMEEGGTFDIDRLVAEHPKSERDRIYMVTSIVKGLEDEYDMVPIERVLEEAQQYHNIDKRTAERLIQELLSKGDLYEPRHGHLKTVRG